jgi:hypothetical protein
MAITSPAGVRVSNPTAASGNTFSNSANLGLLLESYSTKLNSDPDLGFAQTQQTNLVQAPAVLTGKYLVTDVTYGPAY